MSNTIGEVITEIFEKIKSLGEAVDLISKMPAGSITPRNQQVLKERFDETRVSMNKILRHFMPTAMFVEALGKAEIIDGGEIQIPAGFVEEASNRSLITGGSADDIMVKLCDDYGIPEKDRTSLIRFTELFLMFNEGKRG